jgi:hypothetical protein
MNLVRSAMVSVGPDNIHNMQLCTRNPQEQFAYPCAEHDTRNVDQDLRTVAIALGRMER